MFKLGCLLLLWTICEGVFSAGEDQKDPYPDTLDFAPNLESGPVSLASGPLASAILKLDTSQYPLQFDSVVSSSIDSLQSRVAPIDSFASERFGFNPIASKGFLSTLQSARLVQPKQQNNHQTAPRQSLRFPLQYDIRTIHDANYKVYKPENNEQEDILSSLKQNPSVAAYFNKPAATNIEVSHPLKYRKEQVNENSESIEQDYRPDAYITGSPRVRRYTDGKIHKQRNSSDEEDDGEDPYNYKAEYVSKPKAFDGDDYRSSPYKEEKDPNKDYEYPYDYDAAYDHKEYDRIKELSEKQAAEIKQNPENCKEVLKDGMKCTTCKDPKTGGNFESCSYVAEPKNNKYAYSKERKFDSKDDPEEAQGEPKSDAPGPSRSAKYQEASKEDDESSKPYAKQTSAPEDDGDGEPKGKYKSYYTAHSSQPKTSAALRSSEDSEDDENSGEQADSLSKPYNYKQALPGFYSDNEPKKDVEHVLAEFKKKDRSTCKKVQKNGMTCFQCIDKAGLKNEECMYVSESVPKRSHLAYQELKEFTSKPATLNGNDEAESQTVPTSAALPKISASYVAAPNAYGRKVIKKKKAPHGAVGAAATHTITSSTIPATPTQQPYRARKVKRSEESGEARAAIDSDSSVAPPEEFAGDNSKGAFWSETEPQYSAALGVTLPQYMLAASEHEAAFDEAVAGV